MEEERPYVELDLDIEDVYLIYNSVKFHYEKWPGGHPDEQARLNFMKNFLYRIVLQYKFENM
ncbi:hypothetical protein [Synechococcus phage S-B05]|jgi:hypothetical protein|nr:hypothetical protein [Synechococcus phage S-B05]